MASSSPPGSPPGVSSRPASAMMRPPPRANSRMSMSGNNRASIGASMSGGTAVNGSRASDEDGKTSVKVVIRVRPPLKSTDPGFELIPQRFQRSVVQLASPSSLTIESPQGRKLFVFDRVFGEDVNQEGIWDYLTESTNHFIQGYNVSLLAYGQSGAGKSYTMGTSGPADQADMDIMGVIPRAAAALFEKLEGGKATSNRNSMSGLRAPVRYSMNAAMSSNKPVEKNWSLKATYVEIYNETLRDLLLPENTPSHERGTILIREDKNHIFLTGLREVEINSVDDLMAALNSGSSIRQTDATAINAQSSRSHAVFSLRLIQHKSKSTTGGSEKRFSVPLEGMNGGEGMVKIDSKLHFVDLAGSERLKNTGAQGERAKEGISINAGLASLGKVISQLAKQGAHISYRDSKLTRLLSDSLGGSAITYMIACITPAEFHISETLNTLQYAQRTRAIQSKPKIQQTVDESDKTALIERLKAELAFLHKQIQSERAGERGERASDRRVTGTTDRSDRSNEREVELQNQLLDTQENYTALSQRHAKLISELAKARDEEQADNQAHEDSLGDSATQRLNRSNSFAEAVEKVVMEYEKTIQSLEQSLSQTRSSLSNIEQDLLEKENKCAYVETHNTQLQARLQKMLDRESSTEHYLHDLEAKLDGHTSGEEKNSAIVSELKREIARVRENEATCEDYISTLEERLAEAEQEQELMQREIDRLEHVVERQRSLGKLDSLLYELDHIQQEGKIAEVETPLTNGKRSFVDHSRQHSLAGKRNHNDVILETEDEDEGSVAAYTPRTESEGPVDHGEPIDEDDTQRVLEVMKTDYPLESPAQLRFVEDKLQNVSQELYDLKVEHESTINEFDLLNAKHEEALRMLATLQEDAADEARHPTRRPRDSILSVSSLATTRPTSFLADARVYEQKDGGQFSSSRSLSSELSLAGEQPSTADLSDAEASTKTPREEHVVSNGLNEETYAEVEHLRTLVEENEQAQHELAEKYNQLEEEHTNALDMVEELKTEIKKFQMNENQQPSRSSVIRRKSSQNTMIISKAHRAFASLQNIGDDNFAGNEDLKQNFDLNMKAALNELHIRSERVEQLEVDVAEKTATIEEKNKIINGLTKERASITATSMDMSAMSILRNQLEDNELQTRTLRDLHASREQELKAQIEELNALLAKPVEPTSNDRSIPNGIDETAAIQGRKLAELEQLMVGTEEQHQGVVSRMQEAHGHLESTILGLEQQLSTQKQGEGQSSRDVLERDETVKSLQSEIDNHKGAVAAHALRLAQLEETHALTRDELEQVAKSRDASVSETNQHKSLISRLEDQIIEHGSVIKSHQDGLNLLHANHARSLDELKSSTQADHEAYVAELTRDHQESTNALQNELSEARDNLTKIATQVAFALGVDVSTEKLQDRISDLLADQKALAEEQAKNGDMEQSVAELTSVNEKIMTELETVKAELSGLLVQTANGAKLKAEHATVTEQLAALKKEMSDLETKNKKNSRLVEELEDQLATNFDQHQMANNRLSTLQTERNTQLEEATAAHIRAQSELEAIKEEYASLQSKLDDAQTEPGQAGPKRSNSQGHLRKSASVASLPSPPPAIPLPPLPGNINAALASSQTAAAIPIPATPTGNRPTSKDLKAAQIQEDQEARIRTIEKHLYAEKQLTNTLEEALTDLERQSNKVKADCDAWRRRAGDLEQDLKESNRKLQSETEKDHRHSMLQVEEERKKRQDAENARANLEERMNAISKKKKKGSLNCF